MLAPEGFVQLSQTGALAPDGRSKTFDEAADGYGRGEGCGVVVLRRLSDALADGDPVLAVILGSAVNHDGHSSGLTVPNGSAQQDVIRTAIAAAGVEPAQVGYIQAHGTGTPLGDPIEVAALGAVLGDRDPTQPVQLRSVKTNIGHLEAAAGISGLIEAVLVLQHRTVPANLHLRSPNPDIATDWPFELPTEATPLTGDVVGVSAFGLSGTNAHLVLGAAPSISWDPPHVQAAAIPLSGRTPPPSTR